jgi:hypothetical protein
MKRLGILGLVLVMALVLALSFTSLVLPVLASPETDVGMAFSGDSAVATANPLLPISLAGSMGLLITATLLIVTSLTVTVIATSRASRTTLARHDNNTAMRQHVNLPRLCLMGKRPVANYSMMFSS